MELDLGVLIEELEELPRGEEVGAAIDAALLELPVAGHQIARVRTQCRGQDGIIFRVRRHASHVHGQCLDTGLNGHTCDGRSELGGGEALAEIGVGERARQLGQDGFRDDEGKVFDSPPTQEFAGGALWPGLADQARGQDIRVEDRYDHAVRCTAASFVRLSAMISSILASNSGTGTSANA